MTPRVIRIAHQALGLAGVRLLLALGGFGVAVLLAVSLAFEPELAAVLAGVLGGMALVGAMGLVDLAVREHRDGVRYYVDASDASRRYVQTSP